MADNNTMAKGDTLVGSDSESFMSLMNKALARIEKVDAATNKANESLKAYAKTFDDLNSKLEEYVHLSGDVKANKFNKVTIKTYSGKTGNNNRQGNRNNSIENEVQELRNKSNKAISESADLIFNAINSLGGKYSRTITNTIGKVSRVASKSKSVAKASKEVAKYSTEVAAAGKATTGLTKTVAALGTKAGVVGGVVAGTVLVLGLMAEAGKYAYERNQQLNRSLMQMGVNSNELTDATSNTANKMISIKNTWIRIGDDLAGAFEPFFDIVVDLVDYLGKAVETITGTLDKDADYSYADTRVRGYTRTLESKSGEPENKSIPTISSIAGSAKQSGFDNNSAANLAIGTYDRAMALARKYGLEASEIAKQLADAWLTGSEAAKNYGVVVDDQVLAGYMASKGVDIVNTRITDAMKQYYRYQLMLEEASSDNSDYMQEQIKQWKRLGFQIEATKGKLFSFDEVIQLNATDSTIPTVGKPGVNYPSGGDKEGTTPLPGVIPPGNVNNKFNGPVKVPVVYEEPEPLELPQPEPVYVPVFCPGLQLLPELAESLELIYNMVPLPVTVPVGVPGLELVPELQSLINHLPINVPVNVPVEVPGLELVNYLLGYCRQLALTTWTASVLVNMPNLYLAPLLLEYLVNIAKNWVSTIDISVAGQKALEKAYELLEKVRSMLATMGQSVVYTAKNYVNNKVSETKGLVSGLTAKNGSMNVFSSWAPTNADAYGGGLKGALLADLDLNLTRVGLKSSTKEGYTSSQINKASGKYLGYNLNPLHSGSAAQGLTMSALALSGLGAPATSTIGVLAPAFANGGIGTKEVHNATLFENNKKEAVIPLETSTGIKYLSDALQEAGLSTSNSGDITINLTLSGVNIADNNAEWERVGKKIAEVIEVQRQRRGELNYGSRF